MKEWHKVTEEYPKEHGRYLTCDRRGNIQVKVFDETSIETIVIGGAKNCREVNDPHFRQGKDVCFWMELPEAPSINWQKLEELKILEERRAQLNKEIKKLMKELG
jgi:hypothetical protein